MMENEELTQQNTDDKPVKAKKTRGVRKTPRRIKQMVTKEGGRVNFPDELSSETATLKDLVLNQKQLEKCVLVLHESVSKYRDMFKALKLRNEVSLDAIYALATQGCDKKMVTQLLGIPYDIFQRRQDVEEAYNMGLAGLGHALLGKQVEVALKGDRTMMIWMGKQILGQKDTPTTQVNIQNNGVGVSSIRSKVEEARQKALTAFKETVEAVDVQVTTTGQGE